MAIIHKKVFLKNLKKINILLKYSNITNLVGNTPLIKLKKASEITGCNILGKAEYLNPGQSIKDRAALYMIKNARKIKS